MSPGALDLHGGGELEPGDEPLLRACLEAARPAALARAASGFPREGADAPGADPVPVLYLGHGASGSAATMAPHVAGLRARGIDARAVDLPRGRAERAVPVVAELLVAGSTGDRPVAVGGHSFGGRVASLAAADACGAGRPPLALVLLSYPLHAPGRSDDWDARTAHWSRITCPVILLSGTSDPFATRALLERACAERLPAAELVAYPRLGHTLAPVLEDVLGRVAAFLRATGTRRVGEPRPAGAGES